MKAIGGRPRTGRETAATFRLSDEAIALLGDVSNKSEYVDSIILGTHANIRCPHCGHIVHLNVE